MTPDGDYQLSPSDEEPRLYVREVNPIHLYLDPIYSPNPRWMVLGYRKLQEVMDDPYTIESKKNELQNVGGSTQPLTSQPLEGLPIALYNQLNTTYIDTEKWVMNDTFYFPYVKVGQRILYNVSVTMIENQIITQVLPNVAFPESQLVQTPWQYQTESNYGYGPADWMQNLQIQVNMLSNYFLETLARNGNTWVIAQGTDLRQLFGGVARILTTPKGIPVNEAAASISSSHEELQIVTTMIQFLIGQMVNVGGSQDPFQGQFDKEVEKTATEMNILQSNATSRVQESTEHIGNSFVVPVLERLMYMAAHLYPDGIKIRIDDPASSPVVPGQQPAPQDIQMMQAQQIAPQNPMLAQQMASQAQQTPYFRMIDLSVLRSGQFVIEMTSVNLSQSKEAQAQLMLQLIQMIASNPQGAILAEPVMQKYAVLEGWKDFAEVFDLVKARFAQMQQQTAMTQQAQAMQQAATVSQDRANQGNLRSDAGS